MKLIDTSVLVEFIRGKTDIPEDSVLTVVSYYELLWKALERGAKNEVIIIRRIFSFFPLLDIDATSVDKAADVKFKLRRNGYDVNDFDVLIAGIALANGIEEIWTKDKDFEKIERVSPEIKVKIFG